MKDDEILDTWRRTRVIALVSGGLAILLGMFAPQGAAFWRVTERLQAAAETALLAAGRGGVEVAMDGQSARLTGVLEDEEAIASAERAALTSAGRGGIWSGGVTEVDASGLIVGDVARPFEWGARIEPTRVVLSGSAPSESSVALLANAAEASFPNRQPVNDMRVAGGAPSPLFASVAALAISRLSGLTTGEVRFVDNQIVFIGDGHEAGVTELKRAFADPPAPFQVRIEVTVDGLDPANPELQGLNLVSGDAEECGQAFERLLEVRVINFATGSAAIDPSSRRLLDSLASVALQCDRFSIEVGGHTDNQGARDANMALSTARAEAVAEYLARRGVNRERLTARGYGAERPRASNQSEAGRAANRRIEFNVSG